jgi:hypothetical protein
MAFLSYAGNLKPMFMALAGITLILAVLMAAMPVGILVTGRPRGPRPEKPAKKDKKTKGKKGAQVEDEEVDELEAEDEEVVEELAEDDLDADASADDLHVTNAEIEIEDDFDAAPVDEFGEPEEEEDETPRKKKKK